MLNEMIIGRMKCPVCGRYFFCDLKYYWCPFCGTTNHDEQIQPVTKDARITSRDQDGIAVYVGPHEFNSITYAPFLRERAMTEVLEKLCELEEEKENETI